MSDKTDYIESVRLEVILAYTMGVNSRKIAKDFKIDRSSMYAILRSHGLELRRKGKRKLTREQEEQIVADYNSGNGVRSISERLHLSKPSVYNVLHEAGVKPLSRLGRRFDYERRLSETDDLNLVAMYEQKDMSIKELAAFFNVSTRTIYVKLKEAEVEVRNWSGPKTHFTKFANREGRLCRFRSTWEKKFAEHLDASELDWAYESHTYILSDGTSYTPDFWVPAWDVLIEVKGMMTERAQVKIDLFRKEYAHLRLLVLTSRELALYGIDLSAVA